MPRALRLWGVVGALLAAIFAVWMLFFPQLIPTAFAWNAQPRAAQAFIGAGYLFRTYFFLLFVFVADWRLLRWSYYGNLLFTGALLLATLWHAPEMHWLTVDRAHLDRVLYHGTGDHALHDPEGGRAAGGAGDERRPDCACVPLVPDPRGGDRDAVRAGTGRSIRSGSTHGGRGS